LLGFLGAVLRATWQSDPDLPRPTVEVLIEESAGAAARWWRAGIGAGKATAKKQGKGDAKKGGASAAAQEKLATLLVIALNEKSRPLPDVVIAVGGTTATKGKGGRTDARGEVALTLPLGRYDLLATHREYAPAEQKGVTLRDLKKPSSLTLRLTPGTTVTGTILNEERKPLQGVAVTGGRRRLEHFASAGDVYLDDASYRLQHTDEQGRYAVGGIGAGENLLEFRLPGYQPESRTFRIKPGDKPKPVDVTLRRPAVITGRIVDEDQNPVSTATVTINRYSLYGYSDDEKPAFPASTISTTTGSFTLKRLLTQAAYEVRVDHPGFAPAIIPQVPADSHDLTWQLDRGGAIEGQTVWIDVPTSPAQVNLRADTVLDGTTYTATLTSGLDGHFRFDRLPFGVYRVRVDQGGFASEAVQNLRSQKGRATTGVLVEVYKTALLGGKVIDATTGDPIANARITVHASYGPGGARKRNFTVASNDRGLFQFRNLPAGAHTISGRAEGYLASESGSTLADEITLLPGARVQDFVLRLSKGGTVEGYVRDSTGGGVPEAEVQLFNGSPAQTLRTTNLKAITDGTGYFMILGFPLADRLQLYASATKRGFAKARSPLIDITPERPHIATEITMTPGGTIRGKVVDNNNRPIGGVKITYSSREFPGDPNQASSVSETTAEGLYFVEQCTPGIARVTASMAGYVTQSKSVTVRDGKMTDTVNFKLLQGLAITGTVADYSGNPIADAKVSAIPLEKATGYASDTTDKKGEFRLPGLSAGNFRLEATFTLPVSQVKQVYTFIEPSVPAGALGVPIDCDVEASASGKVVDDEGRGINNIRVILRSRNDTNPTQDFRFSIDRFHKLQGLFQLEKVPRGLYSMEVEAQGYETYRNNEVVIGPHKTTRMPRIRLERAAQITGVVLSATDKSAINGATVRVLDSSLPEVITVNRTELAAYPRQDVIEYLEIAYDTDADLDPNRHLRPYARVRGNVAARARTDYSGKFDVDDIGNGRFTIEVEHPRFEALRLDNIVVSRDRVADLGEIYLQPGGAIQGRVVAADGSALSNAAVRIPGERAGRNSTRTDTAGNYLVRGVKPGRWPVTVRTTVGNRNVYVFAWAEVRPDQTTQLDFVIELSANARGVLIAADGTVVRTGSVVRLYPTNEVGAVVSDIVYSASTRGAEFTISGIPPGQYLAVATGTASAGAFSFLQVVQVPRGTTDFNFQLGLGQIAGRLVTGEAPAPAVRVQLRPAFAPGALPNSILNLLLRSGTTGTAGGFNFRYLQSGTWHLYTGNPPPPAPSGEFLLSDGQRLTGLVVPY